MPRGVGPLRSIRVPKPLVPGFVLLGVGLAVDLGYHLIVGGGHGGSTDSIGLIGHMITLVGMVVSLAGVVVAAFRPAPGRPTREGGEIR
jgi:hypothetical protein